MWPSIKMDKSASSQIRVSSGQGHLISLRLPSHEQGELQQALRSQKSHPSHSEEPSSSQEHVSRALLTEQLISTLLFQRGVGHLQRALTLSDGFNSWLKQFNAFLFPVAWIQRCFLLIYSITPSSPPCSFVCYIDNGKLMLTIARLSTANGFRRVVKRNKSTGWPRITFASMWAQMGKQILAYLNISLSDKGNRCLNRT